MKVFVTGVNGQLGHDVMNELAKRGIACVGSDLKSEYSGVADGSAVTTMPYAPLDITDKEAVNKVISKIHPDKNNISVTISLGVSQFNGSDNFIRCADEALYKSKKTGRNKVSVSDENL